MLKIITILIMFSNIITQAQENLYLIDTLVGKGSGLDESYAKGIGDINGEGFSDLIMNIAELGRQEYISGLPDTWNKNKDLTANSYTDNAIDESKVYGYKVRYRKGNDFSDYSNSNTTTYTNTTAIVPDYYISSSSGNDNNNGTSENTAWASLSKLSTIPTHSVVGLKRGDTWAYTNITAKLGCTYTSYGSGAKPKIGGAQTNNSRIFTVEVDFVTIQNIELESKVWIKVYNANYVTVDNCNFHHYVAPGALEADADHSANNPFYIINSDYFTLKNSSIHGNYNSRYQDMIVITKGSQYTLIENNYIDGGSHVSLYFRGAFSGSMDREYNDDSPNHQIIKDNHFFNHSHHSFHSNVGAWATLLEHNYFERSGTGIDSANYYNRVMSGHTIGSAMYFYGSGICRYNIIRRSGSDVNNRAIDQQNRYGQGSNEGKRSESWDMAIYNNSFWNNWSEGIQTGIYLPSGYSDNLKYENMFFVNNAFGGSKNPTDEDFYYYKSGTSKDYEGTYKNNSFEKPYFRYGSGTYHSMTIADFNSNPPGNIVSANNLHVAPNFTNPDGSVADGDVETAFNNFKLNSSSSLIDAGAYLATLSSGVSNSNQITVGTKEGLFFFDGWGLIPADTVLVDGVEAVITSISGDTITLDRNVTASSGAPVTLKYNGTKPDIGAVESEEEIQGGTLTENTVWSGDINILGTITVPTGVNLTVQSGTNLKFSNNSTLKVYGTLNVNGSSDNKVNFDFGNKGYPSGIWFYQYSNGTIDNAIIKNSYYGIKLDKAEPTIKNTEIYNCKYGILFAYLNSVSADPQILNNKIHDNNYYGLYFYSSGGKVRGNKIYNNSRGVYARYLSSPKFGYNNYLGHNHIYNNSYGFYAYISSSPDFGRSGCTSQGGSNKIENNSYKNGYANYYCEVFAENNWWGSSPPDTSKISAVSNSTIHYEPWLGGIPFSKIAANNNSPEEKSFNMRFNTNSENSYKETRDDNKKYNYNPKWSIYWKLLYVRNLIVVEDYKFASDICKEIIDEHPDSSLSFWALDLLWQATQKKEQDDFTKYLVEKTLSKDKKELYGDMELILANYETSRSTKVSSFDAIGNKYADTRVEESSLFQKFMYYFNDEEDVKTARSISDDLDKKYPNSESALEVHRLLGDDVKETEKELEQKNNLNKTANILPEKYELLGNFPNPFNPSTTIKYALPFNSNVELTIYNMNGQLIKSFSINSQSPGYANIVWDGTNNNGTQVTSGVYIYKLKAVSLENNREVFEKSAKLILLK